MRKGLQSEALFASALQASIATQPVAMPSVRRDARALDERSPIAALMFGSAFIDCALPAGGPGIRLESTSGGLFLYTSFSSAP